MAFNTAPHTDDWTEYTDNLGGAGLTTQAILHSAVTGGNALTDALHVTKCHRSTAWSGSIGVKVYEYVDNVNGAPSPFDDADSQWAWMAFRFDANNTSNSTRRPQPGIWSRLQPLYNANNHAGYWMTLDVSGYVLKHWYYLPTGEDFDWTGAGAPAEECLAYYSTVDNDGTVVTVDDWHAMKIVTTKDGGDLIIDGYKATGQAVVDALDVNGEPTWDQILQITHDAGNTTPQLVIGDGIGSETFKQSNPDTAGMPGWSVENTMAASPACYSYRDSIGVGYS